MTMHAVSFTLYNLSIIVFYVIYFIKLSNKNEEKEYQLTHNSLIAWTVTTYLSFVAQLCLNWIFL